MFLALFRIDFALVRFLPDGRLDTSFGSSGVVTTDLFGDLDVQPDGRILAAGFSHGYTDDFALARYLGRCERH